MEKKRSKNPVFWLSLVGPAIAGIVQIFNIFNKKNKNKY